MLMDAPMSHCWCVMKLSRVPMSWCLLWVSTLRQKRELAHRSRFWIRFRFGSGSLIQLLIIMCRCSFRLGPTVPIEGVNHCQFLGQNVEVSYSRRGFYLQKQGEQRPWISAHLNGGEESNRKVTMWQNYFQPTSIEEALELLEQYAGKERLVAG